MKKTRMIDIIIIITGSLLALFAVFSAASADTISNRSHHAEDLYRKNNRQTTTFPSALLVIEDGAFDGTAFFSAELPVSIEKIGEQAFANNTSLRMVFIPDDIITIRPNAFEGSKHVTISGTAKGFVRTWANENGIPFSPIAGYYAHQITECIAGANKIRVEIYNLLLKEKTEDTNRCRPTGRASYALNTQRFEAISAFNIQGRSPPAG